MRLEWLGLSAPLSKAPAPADPLNSCVPQLARLDGTSRCCLSGELTRAGQGFLARRLLAASGLLPSCMSSAAAEETGCCIALGIAAAWRCWILTPLWRISCAECCGCCWCMEEEAADRLECPGRSVSAPPLARGEMGPLCGIESVVSHLISADL